MSSLSEQIKSLAKTANSRIRRHSDYTASGSGVMPSGYYSTGSKGLTTSEKRQRIRDLKAFIQSTDTAQTRGARRTRERARKSQPFPRTVPQLAQSDIATWNRRQLERMIKSEGAEANRRLKAARKSGLDNFMVERFRDLERFDTNTRGKTDGELQLMYLRIRDFLSHDYTTEGLEEARETLKNRMLGEDSDIDEDFFNKAITIAAKLKRDGFSVYYVDSNTETILEYVREGLTYSEIYNAMLEQYDEWISEQRRRKTAWQQRNVRRRFRT